MTAAPTPNSRASLLAGLRTGGVRATSASIPQTAAPGGSFNVPRFASQHHTGIFPEEDDQVAEIPSQTLFVNNRVAGRTMPMTAAVDGPNSSFSHQQQRGMNPNSIPFSPGFAPNMIQQATQAQSLQLQMMQLELMKIQAQQYQAELMAQAQRQQQAHTLLKKPAFNPPATAGPLSTSFDLRTAALSAQMRRANQAEQVRSQLSVNGDDHVPMTAALGGKFGSRTTSLNAATQFSRFNMEDSEDLPPPATPNSTTVISGGTSLGSLASNNIATNNAPSKSDSATSWRRGNGTARSFTSPSVKITPPPIERVSPPPQSASTASTATPTTANSKFRPQPLRFSAAVSKPLPVVAIDSSNDTADADDSSSSSSKSNSNSSPTTPHSSSSNESPLSLREEASKKLYEGLGIGRPTSIISNDCGNSVMQHSTYQTSTPALPAYRAVSQPTRQPRGPPSALEELGPKNFASRIRRKAIGGLGMLMGTRERREFVEAY